MVTSVFKGSNERGAELVSKDYVHALSAGCFCEGRSRTLTTNYFTIAIWMVTIDGMKWGPLTDDI
jgi:hypothetical protein